MIYKPGRTEKNSGVHHEYETNTKDPEAKEFSKKDFGHMAEEAAKAVINELPDTEVIDAPDAVDEYDKIDFWVRSKAFDHDLPIQFTVRSNPCEQFGKKRKSELTEQEMAQLSKREKEQLEALEEKAEECPREVELWASPPSYYKEACRRCQKEIDSDPEFSEGPGGFMKPNKERKVAQNFLENLSRSEKKTYKSFLKTRM